ncbi:serine protease [Clostridium brassicae]|uniref:Trypsin-like peptidase domain-containing protein n=1 Tax=Clostridium brassicae TaxID=2999072 RepID=A0ABT4DFJ6_9CLOT|nr:serine protease [Clostridium brassicae]MCY6959794.1 trypsin-like peptidase domain-containing protein [Clostridium brassicae]
MIVKIKSLKTNVIRTKNIFENIEDIFNVKRMNTAKGSFTKDIIFCRYIGIDCEKCDYIDKLKELDMHLQSTEASYINFTKGIKQILEINEIESAKKIMEKYDELENENYIKLYKLFQFNMGYEIKNECLEFTKKLAFKEIMDLYDVNNKDKSKTARKNFGIKLLLWMNKYLKHFFENKCDVNIRNKVMFYGDIKEHEIYFLILLSKLGCDIVYINPKEDIDYKVPQINNFSNVIRNSKTSSSLIEISFDNIEIKKNCILKENSIIKPKDKHDNIKKETKISKKNIEEKIEKSYQELANLAQSVVMINVYNENEELVGKGSGVVINHNGFIITNFHVLNKGVFYGVVFENDTNEYMSYNIIKCHSDYDLALIKVDKIEKPIKLNIKDLVRGQKIIAIGSPLGLFNTISDGIVSGFRKFDFMEMVQITAPISPGSSGGALIDLYGNLVGITTSGLDGQNLNMAVTAKHIKNFCGNILNKEKLG